MFLIKAGNIYEAFEPLHFVSRLTGLSSFSLTQKDGKFKAAYTWFDDVLVAVTSLWCLLFAVLVIVKSDQMWRINVKVLPDILVETTFFLMISFPLTTVVSHWCILFLKKNLAKILNLIIQVDDELVALKHPIDLRKEKRKNLITSVAIAIFSTSLFILTIFASKSSDIYTMHFVLSLSLGLCQLSNFFLTFQFVFFVSAIKSRFQKINLVLREDFWFANGFYGPTSKLNKAAYLHDMLVDACQFINRFYGIPVSSNFPFKFHLRIWISDNVAHRSQLHVYDPLNLRYWKSVLSKHSAKSIPLDKQFCFPHLSHHFHVCDKSCGPFQQTRSMLISFKKL